MSEVIYDPQQELFSAILVSLRTEFGDDKVYDAMLPPADTPYPFIYLADNSFNDDGSNKTQILGDCYQTVHVWHSNLNRRGELSAIMQTVKQICRQIASTTTYSWRWVSADQRIITDNTTKAPLMHGVIELHYKLKGDHTI